MAASRDKISFSDKVLSRKFYLTEVPVENKKTVLSHFLGIPDYAKDVMKIMRTGSCIALLSDFVPIEAKTFFRLLYFEDHAKYVFWTFNKNFIADLLSPISLINEDNVKGFIELLKLYPAAYDDKLDTGEDKEIAFCFRKLNSLKKDEKFNPMFQLDMENRNTIRRLLEQRLSGIENGKHHTYSDTIVSAPSPVLFSEMLVPINCNVDETLQIIKCTLEIAGVKHNLFSKAPATKNNKNPKGFNDSLAAMVSFFYECHYFLPVYSKEEILEAHLYQYQNKIPKYNGNFNFFTQNYSYKELLKKLQRIKIDKL